jgi:flagellar biosynthesis chaperone FliJ
MKRGREKYIKRAIRYTERETTRAIRSNVERDMDHLRENQRKVEKLKKRRERDVEGQRELDECQGQRELDECHVW